MLFRRLYGRVVRSRWRLESFVLKTLRRKYFGNCTKSAFGATWWSWIVNLHHQSGPLVGIQLPLIAYPRYTHALMAATTSNSSSCLPKYLNATSDWPATRSMMLTPLSWPSLTSSSTGIYHLTLSLDNACGHQKNYQMSKCTTSPVLLQMHIALESTGCWEELL